MLLQAKGIPKHPLDHKNTVDLVLPKGGVIWLSGANGCGKTTVLRVLAGRVKSLNLSLITSKTQYIASYPLLLNGLTVQQQLSYYQNIYQCENPKCLNLVSDFLDKPVWQLSQGQGQRLSLMRLFYSDANVWLLDEPYNALDKESVQILNQAIFKHTSRGGGVIYSSHIPIIQGETLCLT